MTAHRFDELSTYGGKFIVEPSGTSLTDHERAVLSELRPAGVMFRTRNFLKDVPYEVWLEAYSHLVADLRETIGRDHLILCIDHEGGRVVRPPPPITRFPYPAKWSNRAGEVGHAMALELRSLGINLSFSPVADIHSNPENPVINQRAFGRTAEEVIPGVLAFAEALAKEGVSACAKHFPGHGDTGTDSHFTMPVLPFTYEEIRKRELLPFCALIEAGIRFIMSAHIMLPAIDRNNLATFSDAIISGVLRRDLGFTGVIIADAMGMKAVVDQLDRYETTVTAVNAGLDLYCVAGDSVNLDSAKRWAEFMRDGVRRGDIAESTIAASIDRVEGLAADLPNHDVMKLREDLLERHRELARVLDEVEDWGVFEFRVPGFE